MGFRILMQMKDGTKRSVVVPDQVGQSIKEALKKKELGGVFTDEASGKTYKLDWMNADVVEVEPFDLPRE